MIPEVGIEDASFSELMDPGDGVVVIPGGKLEVLFGQSATDVISGSLHVEAEEDTGLVTGK